MYVCAEHRGLGAGEVILKHLAQLALAKQCVRFEWRVLKWNDPAIKFYQSIGAQPQVDWVSYRLSGKLLVDFANR